MTTVGGVGAEEGGAEESGAAAVVSVVAVVMGDIIADRDSLGTALGTQKRPERPVLRANTLM